MMTNEPTRAKKIFARTCIAICVGIVAFPAIARWVKDRPADYDYEASIAKLKKIGAALQLYRAEYGVKPVAERRNYSDAGLPPSLIFLMHQGHSWTLTEGKSAFQVEQNLVGDRDSAHFASLYWSQADAEQGLWDMSAFYANRGEQLPIYADENIVQIRQQQGSQQIPAIVLRLDGSVSVVEHEWWNHYDIYQK